MALDTFRVAQGVDARFLENTLTKDITPLEALYDLVDNAVDAARERILKSRRPKTDRYGLPSDYGAYRIRLRVGEKTVAISDNCTGIDEETLAKHAFVTGFVSQHKFGIGGFGIGLKRALFRLGTKYALFTDTGRAAAEMRFDKANLSASSQPLDATRAKSSGKTSTLLVIAGLEAGVSHEFAATTRAALSAHLSRRYGLYVKKGLRICVNGERVRGFGPGIRKSGPVSRGTLHISAKKAGVGIYVEAGMHEDYRLTQEADYASAKTGQLTDQYGWYFVCNDRIVRIASRDRNLGWSGSWHQEYYGFVGWVRFVAENPELLPWDTKKT